MIKKIPKYILNRFFFVIAVLRLLHHEIFWLFRLKFLKHFLKNNLLRHVLIELRSRGVCVIPKYYTKSIMEMIRTECRHELDALSPALKRLKKGMEGDIVLEDGLNIERYSGSIKIKGPKNQLLNFTCQDRFLMMVAALFCHKIGIPTLIYHLAHDGSVKHPAIPGSAKVMIANDAHLDSPFHGLKVFTALEKINAENAPFVCLEQSSTDISILRKRVNHLMKLQGWYDGEKSPHCIEDNLLKKLLKKYRSFKGTIQPGDLVLFDTCNVHFPSELYSGKRSMIWLYY